MQERYRHFKSTLFDRQIKGVQKNAFKLELRVNYQILKYKKIE